MNTESTECKLPAQWRWHYDALCGIRDKLLQAREQGLHEASEPIDWRETDPADSASDEFERDLAFTLLSAETDALYEVEAALSRIEEGSYGVCELSGKPIPDDRLRAVPWTRYSRVAAETICPSRNAFRIAALHPLRVAPTTAGEEQGGGEPSPELEFYYENPLLASSRDDRRH